MPGSNLDPRLASLAGRAAALRAELDRIDGQIDDLDPAGRADLTPAALVLRAALDQLDTDLEAAAAGLDPFDQRTWPACQHCGRVQIHQPGCPAVTGQ